MPEVQNLGAVDYAQYQPSQTENNEAYTEAYNAQPEVYDERMAEVQAANKSRLGATLLSAAIIGGLAYWGGHAMGGRAAKAELEKAKEAVSKYEEALEKIKEKSEKIDQYADAVNNSPLGVARFGVDFIKNVQTAAKNIIAKIKGLKEVAEETAEEAAKKAA